MSNARAAFLIASFGLSSFSVGWFARGAICNIELHEATEARRLALDAAVASATAVAPTAQECGSAAYTALDRGWALMQMEGR